MLHKKSFEDYPANYVDIITEHTWAKSCTQKPALDALCLVNDASNLTGSEHLSHGLMKPTFCLIRLMRRVCDTCPSLLNKPSLLIRGSLLLACKLALGNHWYIYLGFIKTAYLIQAHYLLNRMDTLQCQFGAKLCLF